MRRWSQPLGHQFRKVAVGDIVAEQNDDVIAAHFATFEMDFSRRIEGDGGSFCIRLCHVEWATDRHGLRRGMRGRLAHRCSDQLFPIWRRMQRARSRPRTRRRSTRRSRMPRDSRAYNARRTMRRPNHVTRSSILSCLETAPNTVIV